MDGDLAEVCGIHAGDGYLRNDGKRRELDISGNLEEKEYYDFHVVPLFEKVFGISVKPKAFPSRATYGFVTRDKSAIELVHFIGFPYGKKTLTVSVPPAILASKNLELHYRFLRGVFDTDGCLDFNKKTLASGKYSVFKTTRHYYPTIALSTVSKNLFEGLCQLFCNTDFYYHTKQYLPKNPNYHKQYSLCFSGGINLEMWLKNIGIKNTSKFSRYLIWKKFGFCPRKTTFEQRKQILNKELDPHSFYKDP